METISACVVCRNEADKLVQCLESIGWVDEILVMDLRSDDGSTEVARRHGARVIHRDPHPIVEPLRNELAAQATGTWVLALDPDERVLPGLAERLRGLAQRTDIDAVVVPRMNVDFGWTPAAAHQRYEPQLRMYRPDRVRWPEFPNKLPQVAEDRLARVDPRDELVLEHQRNVDVAETAERLVRYAPAQAQAMIDAGQTFRAKSMFRELRRVGTRHFVEARAWEEGVPGLVRATVLVNHHVYVWISFWQLSGAQRTPEDDAAVERIGQVLRLVGWLRRTRRTLRRVVNGRNRS